MSGGSDSGGGNLSQLAPQVGSLGGIGPQFMGLGQGMPSGASPTPPPNVNPLPPGESINTGVTPIQPASQPSQGKQGMTGMPPMWQGDPASWQNQNGMTTAGGLGQQNQGQSTPFPPNVNTSVPGVSQLDPLVAAQQGALLGLNPGGQSQLTGAGTSNPISNPQALGQGQTGQGKPGMTGTPPMFTNVGG